MATRRQIRNRIATLMNAELVGSGHVLAKVHGAPLGDVGETWPLGMLGPRGSRLPEPRGMGPRPALHRFKFQALVKYAEIDADDRLVLDDAGQPVWDEEDAIDTLDAFATEWDAFWMTHRTDDGYWLAVDFDAETEIEIVDTGFGVFLRETYSLSLTCNE